MNLSVQRELGKYSGKEMITKKSANLQAIPQGFAVF